MPQHARNALNQKLERSGLLDQLANDVRILFRKRMHFASRSTHAEDPSRVEVPLTVGAITLGYVSIPGSEGPGRKDAYRRWLNMACRIIADELSAAQPPATVVLPASITRAARVIRERYQDPLSLGEVAREVGLSRERLSRLFHETLGITFSDYLKEVRLGYARRSLTETPSPVTDIAYASGFQSLSQFNRHFKTAEGMSPSAYRRQAERRLAN